MLPSCASLSMLPIRSIRFRNSIRVTNSHKCYYHLHGSQCSYLRRYHKDSTKTKVTTSFSTLNGDSNYNAIKSQLLQPIHQAKGIGNVTMQKFAQLKIHSVGDLLLHYPTNYLDRRVVKSLSSLISAFAASLVEGNVITVSVIVQSFRHGAGKLPHTAKCITRDGIPLNIVYFHNGYDRKSSYWDPFQVYFCKVGSEVVVCGKIMRSKYNNELIITNPERCFWPTDHVQLGKLSVPDCVYPLTEGLAQKKVQSAIQEGLLLLDEEQSQHPYSKEWLNPKLLEEMKWPSFAKAFRCIHEPSFDESYVNQSIKARERLAFEELVALEVETFRKEQDEIKKLEPGQSPKQFVVVEQSDILSKLVSSKKNQILELGLDAEGAEVVSDSLIDILKEALPYDLTECQLQAIQNVRKDLLSDERMVRLVQGDVGSGKTVVAMYAILHAIISGRQAVFLAPTAILARQHFSALQKLLVEVGLIGSNSLANQECTSLPVGLLTGSTKQKERLSLLNSIALGATKVLIGTHSLLHDDVVRSFKDLSLVVMDEEQRFGVAQRNVYAYRTNILYTTATPIPRSLSLLSMNNFSVSTLHTPLPSKRHVVTQIVDIADRHKVHSLVLEHVPHGSKVFWVMPSFNASAQYDGSSALERFEELSNVLPGKVGLLHGKMSTEEKSKVLDSFAKGEISVLVTTTVIEVGIDVVDASICIVERADNFGLCQLHQIRGRIGRGASPKTEILPHCICLFLAKQDSISDSSSSRERLQLLANVSDCFAIAEHDLRMRGPGDWFGFRQHGPGSYKIATIKEHVHLINLARGIAHELVVGNYKSNDATSISMNDFRIQRLLGLFAPSRSVERMKEKSSSTAASLEADPTLSISSIDATVNVQEDNSAAADVLPTNEILDSDLLPWNPLSIVSFTAFQDRPHHVTFTLPPGSNLSAATHNFPVVIILDLEATGLRIYHDRIIQMAAKVLGGDEADVFNAYIKTNDVEISPLIQRLTGISQSFVDVHGIPFSMAWPQFVHWVEAQRVRIRSRLNLSHLPPVALLAHNGKNFDFPMLAAEYARLLKSRCSESGHSLTHTAPAGLSLHPSWTTAAGVGTLVDTLVVFRSKQFWFEARKVDPEMIVAPSKAMSRLYEHLLKRPMENAHDAVGDVTALAEMLDVPCVRDAWRNAAQETQFVQLSHQTWNSESTR